MLLDKTLDAGWRIPANLIAGNWKEVIAADSRKKVLERRDSLLAEHGDATEVVHEGEDGSTIKKLNTQGDHNYESDMMGNCVRGHSNDGNIYSLRDKDNVPQLSFAMDHTTKARCDSCDGQGDVYNPGIGEYEPCANCHQTGRVTAQPNGNIDLRGVLAKENAEPNDRQTLTLMKSVREHYGQADCQSCKEKGHRFKANHPETIPQNEQYNSVSFDGEKNISFDDLDDIQHKVEKSEQNLPKGDVYIKVPEHVVKNGMDEEGNLDLEKAIDRYSNSRPDCSEEKPEPDAKHFIYKTPFTPRRFGYETGLSNHLKYNEEIPEKPQVWVNDEAKFPKNALTLVHKPERPRDFYISTSTVARENPDFYKPEGMSGATPESWIHTKKEDIENSSGDIWHVKLDEDESEKGLVVNPNPGYDTIKLDKDFTIPWHKMELVRRADNSTEFPEFKKKEDGTVEAIHKEPERLWTQVLTHDKKSVGDIHRLEHEGLDADSWSGIGSSAIQTSKHQDYYNQSSLPVHISFPNDPRYVEEVHPEKEKGYYSGQRRKWKFREGVTIPRSEYTIEGAPEEGLTPKHGYLHIPHTFRDSDKVYRPEGIDLHSLTPDSWSRQESEFKITTVPNQTSPLGSTHHKFGPTQSDIFKVDLSKVPDYTVNGENGSYERGETGERVVRINPTPSKQLTVPCSHCNGVGESLNVQGEMDKCPACSGKKTMEQMRKVIPWEAVEGLHNKAEVSPNDEFKKRFSSLRLIAQGWGSVTVRDEGAKI